MKRMSLLAAFLAAGFWGTGGQAENLDPKWDAPQAEARNLVNAVMNGDASGSKKLGELAASGHGPAAYHLGRLDEANIVVPQDGADPQRVCSLYEIGARAGYPPAQGAFAMCHLGGALRKEGDQTQAYQARSLMADAARAGWTPAALHLARYYAGFIPQSAEEWEGVRRGSGSSGSFKDVDGFHLSNAQSYIKQGLESRPDTEQSVAFNYLLGVLAAKKADEFGISTGGFYGGSGGIAFWQGADALQFAIEKGRHAPSLTAMAHLKSRWLFELRQMATSTHKYALSSSFDKEEACLKEGPKLGFECRQFRDQEAQWFDNWEKEFERALDHFDKDHSAILALAAASNIDTTYAGWRDACASGPFSFEGGHSVAFAAHLVCSDMEENELQWRREATSLLDRAAKDRKQDLDDVRQWSGQFSVNRDDFKKKWQHTYSD